MSDEAQFREVERLFHAALALRPERRAGFVNRQCAGDETMRTWLLSLLSHSAAPTVGFTPPPPDNGDDVERVAWPDPAGTRIGPYTLLRQLGEGGFGAVYLAEQAEPIRRTVAIKIIKPGMDSKQVISRFERERQALAMMDHPGIAKVLDAGVTDPPESRPYFVMEFVSGKPITAYCDDNASALNERLELFRDLCRAVQHAHQKGVVHRDLKPSNILVTLADGRASAKVIDFGIAKALHSGSGERLAERGLLTEMGQLIGTPEYMSPEQADGLSGGEDIDTRSDIYSLGVILYELLTGALPFDRRQLQSASFAEIQRIIREVDPPRPSTRLIDSSKRRSVERLKSNGAASPASLAAWTSGDVDVGPFVRALRSDLDWVVMRCMEKDRALRYETADALAQEIGRFLRSEPVIAGPPSATYRMRKFVRRNRTGVMAGACVAAAMMLATVVSVAFGLGEAEQRRVAQAAKSAESEQRRLAEQRLAELEQVVAFQSFMLADFDLELLGAALRQDLLVEIDALFQRLDLPPDEASRRRESLELALVGLNFTNPAVKGLDRHIVQRALETVEREFTEHPLVQARLYHSLGQTLAALGRGQEASTLHERALRIRSSILGDDHRDTLASLAASARGHGLPAAEVRLREALEHQRRVLGDDDPDTLASLSNLGRVIQSQGRLADAEPLLRESLERRRRVYGNDHTQTLDAVAELGVLFHLGDRLDDAESHYREALEGRRRLFGEDHPSTMKSKGNLTWLLHSQGHLEEAQVSLREGVEYNRRVLGDNHPHTLYSMAYLGDLLLEMDRVDEAEAWFRESLEGCLRALGPAHGMTLIAHAGMGALRTEQGLFEEAEFHLQKALKGWRAEGGNRSTLYKVLMSMGRLSESMGRLEEAEECYREVVDGRRTFSREHRRHTLDSIHALARVLAALGRWDEAEEYFREAADGRSEIFGTDHPLTIQSQQGMGARPVNTDGFDGHTTRGE